MKQLSTGVFSQRYWPGVGAGPLDDCWLLGDLMAVHAADPTLRLVSAGTYRQAAYVPGIVPVVPDTATGSEGGALEHSVAAIANLWPSLELRLYRGSWAGFLALIDAGWIASASVLSGALPERLQFGFRRNHRVTVARTSAGLRLLNPLAPPHSKALAITADELRAAMAAYPSVEPACAVLVR